MIKRRILSLGSKREIVRNYILTNPNCTYLDIKRATKIKVERIYCNMIEAYKDAKVELSKNLIRRNKEKQKEDAINYIKNNPHCTAIQIQKNAGVNLVRTFGSILNAYKAAGVHYPEKEVTSGVRNPYVVKRCHDFEKRIFGLLEGLGTVRTQVRTKAGIA